MHEIGNTLTPLMMNAELIVEQSMGEPMLELRLVPPHRTGEHAQLEMPASSLDSGVKRRQN